MKKIYLLIFLAFSLSLFYACQPSEIPKKAELIFGIENDLTNLDPIKSQEPYSLQVIGQIFEGLVTLNARNELEPILAEKWTHSDDYKIWRFQIRKGVFFHEDDVFGAQRTREVTAEDVRFSFQRIVSKDSYPAFALADAITGVKEFQEGKANEVSGLRVVDPSTFEIELQQPEPFFLHRVTSPWFSIFPKEIVDLGPDVFGRTKANGTGPFRLVQRSDTEVVLERNPRYWRPINGDAQKLAFKVIKNEQIRLTELKNSNITIMRLPVALIPGVLESESGKGSYKLKVPFNDSFSVEGFSTFNTHFIGFNCDKVDLHLRRAINFAINRQEIVQSITHNTGTISLGTVPVNLLNYQPPYTTEIYDLDKAKAELKESTTNQQPVKIELLVHEKDNTERLGQLVQSQLKQIGIEVVIKKLDYNSVIGQMVKGDTQAFALAFDYVFSAPEPILNNIFNSAKIPVPNFWHYKNTNVDSQLDKLRSVGDRPQANVISQSIEKQVIDDAPVVFLYQLKNLAIYKKNLSNIAFNGHGIPLLWDVKSN